MYIEVLNSQQPKKVFKKKIRIPKLYYLNFNSSRIPEGKVSFKAAGFFYTYFLSYQLRLFP